MTLRIAYFGAYEPDYPRNLILRRGLEMNGATVVECRVSPRLNTLQRMRALTEQFAAVHDQVDIILLAEFNNTLAFHARRLARQYEKRLVIDFFTSAYDSAVNDREQVRRFSPGALRYWLVDWLALRFADHLLVDTAENGTYYVKTFNADAHKFSVIPVGASHEWFDTPPAPHPFPGTLVQFYGSYIPLHGIHLIIEAAHRLRDRHDIHFELIGKGQTYPAIRALAAEYDLPNIGFRDPVPSSELPALVARADICLGIFGTTPKATRVVPNKVYQTLALHKRVITAGTPALHSLLPPASDLITIAPDPPFLSGAIRSAVAAPPLDPESPAHAHVREYFSEEPLGRLLVDALSQTLE